MGLAQGDSATASDMNAVKEAVDAELKRRCHSGSVADKVVAYTTAPSQHALTLVDQVNNPLKELNYIMTFKYADTDYTYNVPQYYLLKAISSIKSKVDVLAAEPMKQNGATSCSSGCTGLCTSSCWNACTGCTSSCGQKCAGGCSGCGGCGGGCGDCTSTCYGPRCTGSCEGQCTTCAQECSSSSSCACGTGCQGCTGCGGNCDGGAW